MLGPARKTLTFDQRILELRKSPGEPLRATLSDRNYKSIPLGARLMRLLLLLAYRPGKPLTVDEIHSSIWETDNGYDANKADVQKAVSDLKSKIGPGYVVHDSDSGKYHLAAPVVAQGSLDIIEGFGKWRDDYLINKLPEIHRDDTYKEDLRILTVGFPGLPTLGLSALVERGLRIKVIVTHPDAEEVLKLRFRLRDPEEETAESCGDLIRGTQIPQLRRLHSKRASHFEYRLSRAMPFGPVYHSNDWVIFGTFIAHDSSEAGPMIEADAGGETWNTLLKDFKTRWDDTADPPEL